MLWQKESNTAGTTLYIDILKNTRLPLADLRLNRKKNNEQSVRLRREGNSKYGKNDIAGAMELYNQSICFAEKVSEQLSLAYANRSSCFLKLRLYDRCMVDIQLAKDANYPERLMAKLNDRLGECLKRKSCPSAVTTESEPKLSFDAHVKWPCMANVLEIERNEQFGRLVRATGDIQIGEIVLVEEAYIRIVYGRDHNRCDFCTKEKMNFIPCDRCADTMYCSEKCAANNFHDVECDITVGSKDVCNGESISFILRSVILAINTYATIHELMEFVEKCQESDALEITEAVNTPISKYRTFFKLTKTVTKEHISDFLPSAYVIFNAVMSSKLSNKFNTKASQRFLMHLTIHHGLILRVNSFSGYIEPPNGGNDVDDDGKQFQKEVHLLTSYFNHSCIPNVVKLEKNNVAVCTALRTIEQGEQLFIAYIHDEILDMTEKQRNDKLERTYGFRCQCPFCRKRPNPRDAQLLQMNPDFMYVAANIPRLIEHYDIDLMRDIKAHCVAFLQKYRLQTLACDEGIYILMTLCSLLQKELQLSE